MWWPSTWTIDERRAAIAERRAARLAEVRARFGEGWIEEGSMCRDIPIQFSKDMPQVITVFTEYGPVPLPPGTPRPRGAVPYHLRRGHIREFIPDDLEIMSAERRENQKRFEEYKRDHKMTEEELKQQESMNLRIKKVLENAGISYEDVKARWEEKQRVQREERARREDEEERARREEQLRLYEESLPPAARLFPITKYLALLTPRISADARSLARQAKNEAAEFLLKNGHEMPVEVLARWIADKSQLHTMHAYMGHLGVVAMILRTDEDKGSQDSKLLQSYPAGHKDELKEEEEEEANKLLKKMVNGLAFSYEETVQAAVSALKSIVEEDSKARETELCIAEYPSQGPGEEES